MTNQKKVKKPSKFNEKGFDISLKHPATWIISG